MTIPTTYDQDFFAWAMDTANLLRARRFAEIDVHRVAEELESMGKSEKRELISRLTVLMAHLLKWKYQSTKRSKSWQNTITTQRIDVQELLADSPSLRSVLEHSVAVAYEKALLSAENETGIDMSFFPETCPFSFQDLFDKHFLPEATVLE